MSAPLARVSPTCSTCVHGLPMRATSGYEPGLIACGLEGPSKFYPQGRTCARWIQRSAPQMRAAARPTLPPRTSAEAEQQQWWDATNR